MSAHLANLLVFSMIWAGTAALVVALLCVPLGSKQRALARLRDLSSAAETPATNDTGFFGAVRTIVAGLGHLAVPRTGTARQALQNRMIQSGIRGNRAMYLFRGSQIVAAGAVAVAVWAVLHFVVKLPANKSIYFVAGGLMLGVVIPSFLLDNLRKRRQAALRAGLPDALDMMVLCLEGGISLNAAIQRVNEELQPVHPKLAAEFGIVQREMQLGSSAGEAIRKFAERYQLTDVQNLASVLLQSEQFGASIVKALRVHADTCRQDRQCQAEESAQRAAVMILFPTLLCIFPAIFIVILGPAAFQISEMMTNMR
ncbi:MAG TPA: type II secretion system F family protein [Gemmataceae bacterium]|jgi:tight adherence protein C|nr:type II secretion system F family protein [Gemmataceae bacterium]